MSPTAGGAVQSNMQTSQLKDIYDIYESDLKGKVCFHRGLNNSRCHSSVISWNTRHHYSDKYSSSNAGIFIIIFSRRHFFRIFIIKIFD